MYVCMYVCVCQLCSVCYPWGEGGVQEGRRVKEEQGEVAQVLGKVAVDLRVCVCVCVCVL